MSFTFEGSSGFERMQKRMDDLRNGMPVSMAGFPVERCIDYWKASVNGLPRSNVLRFLLAGGMEATARPSGTEPKLKIYLTAVGKERAESQGAANRLFRYFETRVAV